MPMIAAAAAFAFSAISTAVTTVGVAIGSSIAAAGLGSIGFGVSLAASQIGLGLTTFGASLAAGSISAWATAISLGGSLASMLMYHPPQSAGSQLAMKLDPQAGIPIMFGRTGTGGNVVYRETWGDKNRYCSMVSVMSAGPIQSIDAYYANDFLCAFSGSPLNTLQQTSSISPNGGNTKMFVNRIRQEWRLGVANEATLQTSQLADPNMTANSKLSGLAHVLHVYDYNQDAFPNLAIPNGYWVGHGVLCYDPRQDSTYPGGSGSQRLGQPSTYAWSQNPYICALQWCLGIFDNGVRIAGVGADISQIDVAAFVSAANVADANSWYCGGVSTTSDDKYQVLTAILQAGSGVPITRGGKISVFVNTPLTSLYTITTNDIIGQLGITNSTAYRDRKNRICPQYREETQFWQMCAGDLVAPQDFINEDNGEFKTLEPVYSYVQNITQANQLATYDLCNSREFLTITLVCKPYLAGFEVGQALTINVPDQGLTNQKCVIISKDIDPATWQVSLSLRSETDSKHSFALGQTSTAPAPPSLTVPLNEAPGLNAWAITAETTKASDGSTVPALVINGACDDSSAQNVIFEYSTDGVNWTLANKGPALTTTSCIITGLTYGQEYYAAVSYESVRGVVGDRLPLGPVMAGATTASYVSTVPVFYTNQNSVSFSNSSLYFPNALSTPNGFLSSGNIANSGTPLNIVLWQINQAQQFTSLQLANVGNQVANAQAAASNAATNSAAIYATANSIATNAAATAYGTLNSAILTLQSNANALQQSLTLINSNAVNTNASVSQLSLALTSNVTSIAGMFTSVNAAVVNANVAATAALNTYKLAQAANDAVTAGVISNVVVNLNNVNAYAQSVVVTQATNNTVFAGQISTLGGNIANANVAIQQVASAVALNNTAIVQTTTGLQAGLNAANGAISTTNQIVASNVAVLSNTISTVSAVANTGLALANSTTLAFNAANAVLTQHDASLQAGLNATNATVQTNYQAFVSNTAALTNSVTSLTAYSGAGYAQANATALTLAANTAVLTQTASNLQAGLNASNAVISGVSSTLATANATLTQSVQSLGSTLNGTTANVTTLQGTVNTLNSPSRAYWQVVANTATGSALISASVNGSQSAVLLGAQNIYFGSNAGFDTVTNTLQWLHGGYKRALGAGFGSSSNLLDWTGSSSINVASATPQNANYAVDAGGNVWIGGNVVSSWATYNAFTPAQVVSVGNNLLNNGDCTTGTTGWRQAGSGTLLQTGSGGPNNQAYVYATTNGIWTNDTSVAVPGQTYSFQGQINANGISSGLVRIILFWMDSTRTKTIGSQVNVGFSAAGTGWTAYTLPNQVCPSGAAYARVLIDTCSTASGNPEQQATFVSGGQVGWSQMKMEQGAACTPMSAQSTTGAVYSTGQTIDALQPAQANADVTSLNTAAALIGQGSLATMSSLALGSAQLTGFGSIAGQSSLAYGGSYLTGFGSVATLNNGSTLTAGGITGQGSLATLNNVTWNSTGMTGIPGFLTDTVVRPGYSQPSLRADYIIQGGNQSGAGSALVNWWPATMSADQTSGGTAAGFKGQGSLATLNSVAYGSGNVTGFGTFAAQSTLSLDNGSYFTMPSRLSNYTAPNGSAGLCASNIYYTQGRSGAGTLDALQPSTAFADQTSGATAAGIAGQSYLATNIIDFGNTGSSNLGSAARNVPSFLTDLYGSSGLMFLKLSHGINDYNGQVLCGPNGGFWPATTGSDKTSGATAAGFAGQSAWATLTTATWSPQAIITPNPNLLKNGQFKNRFQFWSVTQAAGWTWGQYASSLSYGATMIGSSNNGQSVLMSDPVPVYGGNPYTWSFFWNGGTFSSNSQPNAFFWAYDGNGNQITTNGGYYGVTSFPLSSNGGLLSGTGTIPSNAVTVRLVVVATQNLGNGVNILVSNVKVELGNTYTRYTDESTTGAVYVGGQTMDSLQPAQYGADVTSGHTAAGIASQSWLATNTINWQNLGNGGGMYNTPAAIYNINYSSQYGTNASQFGTIDCAGISYSVVGNGGWALNNWMGLCNTSGKIVSAGAFGPNIQTGLAYAWQQSYYLSCPSSTQINVASGSIQVTNSGSYSFGSSSMGSLAASTTYSVFYNIQTGAFWPASSGSSAYFTSTSWLYLGSIQTAAGATGGGGYSDPGTGRCVLADSFMPSGQRAGEIRRNDSLLILNADRTGITTRRADRNRLQTQPCVMLTTASGIQLGMTVNTPITQEDGSDVRADGALGFRAAVLDHGDFRWEEIIFVEHIGEREVASISCGDQVYAAGEQIDRFIFTHNIKAQP